MKIQNLTPPSLNPFKRDGLLESFNSELITCKESVKQYLKDEMNKKISKKEVKTEPQKEPVVDNIVEEKKLSPLTITINNDELAEQPILPKFSYRSKKFTSLNTMKKVVLFDSKILPIPHFKTKPVHWKFIADEFSLVDSYWSKINPSSMIPFIDFGDLEESFKLSDDLGGKNADLLGGRSGKKITFLDATNAHLISILLKSLAASQTSLVYSIRNLKVKELTDSFINQMLSYFPREPADLDRIREILCTSSPTATFDEYGTVEQFTLKLYRVPFVYDRFKILKIILDFDESFDDIFKETKYLLDASKNLQSNPYLKGILTTALIIGNFLNLSKSTEIKVFSGLNVESFNAFTSTKATVDGSRDLLDFIAECILKNQKECKLNDFVNLKTLVNIASKYDTQNIDKVMAGLKLDVEFVNGLIVKVTNDIESDDQLIYTLQSLHSKLSKDLKILSDGKILAEEEFCQCKSSFVIEKNVAMDPATFFGIFETFLFTYEHTKLLVEVMKSVNRKEADGTSRESTPLIDTMCTLNRSTIFNLLNDNCNSERQCSTSVKKLYFPNDNQVSISNYKDEDVVISEKLLSMAINDAISKTPTNEKSAKQNSHFF